MGVVSGMEKPLDIDNRELEHLRAAALENPKPNMK